MLDSGSAVLPDGDPDVIRKICYIINHLGSNSINDCLAGQVPLHNSFLHPQKKNTVLEPCSMLNSCTVCTMSFRQFHEKEVRFPQKLLP